MAWVDVAGVVVVAALAPSMVSMLRPRAALAPSAPGAGAVPDLWQVMLSGALMLAYVWARSSRDASPRHTLGLQSRRGVWALPIGVGVALLAFAAAAVILLSFQALVGEGAMAGRDAALEGFKRIPLAQALCMAAWAGVYEEIVARGFLADRLRKGLAYSGVVGKPWLPVVLGAWLFALGHVYQGPVGVVQTFAAGLLFSWATRLDSGVLVAIVAHVVVDAGSFLMLRYAA